MFKFQGKNYEYVDMSPNQTRVNERRMEIPLAMAWLEENKGKRILEVGNVLNHYKPRGYYTHDVLDLYETVPWLPQIMNEDILTWKPEKPYDAVLSVSTLEHTGDPLKAVKNILSWSKSCFITIPFGYNKVNEVFSNQPGLLFMRRVDDDNNWEEAQGAQVAGTEYNKPFPYANAVMIIKR